ncbi:hypothetical protein GCM10008066_11220 [Oxalicibacterium faecigallinarum]|uniref:Glycosyl transferase family 1 domain-containing protein n=1 Tax=Oxalicibacterium faecigallinarum TaxID=573741 RepID=A0A8J3F2E5_9BURK|nr:hypothetical protein GCM10008066_11220 [Oxalicibacterium faecigallinarum]
MQFAGGGKKRYQQAAQQLSRTLGLQDQVNFLGYCNDIPALLKQNQICVLSTHYEGMPLSLIEGMAAGCAVVGSKVVGVQEVIEHELNGLLVEHENAHAMAEALERLLEDVTFSSSLAENARNDAFAHYSMERMVFDYETLFAHLLASHPPRTVIE